ncbi:hypothetical protein ACI0FM_01925 [Paenochrobactrum sp. BZR 588]|uniref:hypothetical protein n=1 Tax=unclassified Paenochrobactrum TaxID=2639760 RepID=UPI003854989E
MRENDLEKEIDAQHAVQNSDGALRLANAMRQAKMAAADRGDSIVDVRQAELARLDLLAADLQPVFDAVPANVDLFDFTVSSGMQPRLWLDATAFVMMDNDRRTYKFVRDSRQGRVVMAQSTDMRRVSEGVTAYIADRLVEREQLLGDSKPVSAVQSDAKPPLITQTSNGFLPALAWFITGALVGAVLLFLTFQERLMPALHSLTGG